MNNKSVKFSISSNLCKKTKKPIDLSQCLPTALHERVSAIINIPSLKNNSFEDHLKLEAEKSLDNDDVPIDVWESAQEFELNIEPRIPQRSSYDENENWISDYTKKMKKERIVWQTKLFKDNKEIHEKPLFEQTEELIDIAAEHFACWLKDLDEESNINKEFVKQLFSIQVEGDASKALNVYPKEISVIPHEVAKILNLPELSIQNNVTKIKNQDRKLRNRKPQTIAFGRLLPPALRRTKFNEDLFDELYKINCPIELRSLQNVFDSILHLKSTKALVAHLKAKPELPRSKYLIDHNMFDVKSVKSTQHKPLWKNFY
ncbi:unnamed protein product [Diamesa hyperborea]